MSIAERYLRSIDEVRPRDLLAFTARSLRHLNLRPAKELGQHFVVSPLLIKTVMSGLSGAKRVFELGTGLGTLTYYLAQTSSHVVTAEVDRRLARYSEAVLSKFNNVDVVAADALTLDWSRFDAFVSNVPYSITSHVIVKLVRSGVPTAILTLQREVCERLCSSEGESEYGRLTVLTRCVYDVKVLRYFSRRSFYPEPEVSSGVVRLTRRERACTDNIEGLEALTRALFSYRNKVLRKVLSRLFDEDVMSRVDKRLLDKRVYQLAISEIVELLGVLQELGVKLR